MQYVLWGGGMRATHFITIIGKENILAIADSDCSKWGKDVYDITTISPSELYEKYNENIIVITPKYKREEIEKELKTHNINWYVSIETINWILQLMRIRLYAKELISKAEGRKIAIHGFNLFSLFAYTEFQSNEISSILILPDSYKNKRIPKDLEQFEIMFESNFLKENKNEYFVFLTSEDASNNEVGKIFEHYNLFNIDYDNSLFDYSYLKKYKDIHKGETCFAVGMGPSLTDEDLNTLARNKIICFGVNGSIELEGKLEWQPNYYCACDVNIQKKRAKIMNSNYKCKFIGETAWCTEFEKNETIVKVHIDLKNSHKPINGRIDATKGFQEFGTVISTICIQMAIYMGFTKIYLLGTDCDYSGDAKHFKGLDTEPAHINFHEDDAMYCYNFIKQYADSHGIEIYNATRGGRLEVFPRVDFDSLFK